MNAADRWLVEVDEHGHLVLPAALSKRFGITPGDRLLLQTSQDVFSVHRPINALARVNIEVTNQCNLECRTCMRNVWDEPGGRMEPAVFDRFIASLRQISPRPLVFFGGFGEPLFHPHILEMVAAVKQLGTKVELITNATLLNEDMAAALIDARLDRLWVSLDGATPECYADVRLGAALPQTLENMRGLFRQRTRKHAARPQIGVAFVAMRRNIADLPEVIRLAAQFGANSISVSNVLPHTSELREEILYRRSMYDVAYLQYSSLPRVDIPRMDIDEETLKAIGAVLRAGYWTRLADADYVQPMDLCPFLNKGSLSIRWDGQVSPCLPLLHSHRAYLEDRERFSKEYLVGSILEKDLLQIWQDPDYVAFRQRLQSFDFSPCVLCNSCEMANDNSEDCFGNVLPTCGGCLWAQGLIQCP